MSGIISDGPKGAPAIVADGPSVPAIVADGPSMPAIVAEPEQEIAIG
jgi:hypothetical protein